MSARGSPATRHSGPLIINEVTPISHNRDREYCILSEEWDPVCGNSDCSEMYVRAIATPLTVMLLACRELSSELGSDSTGTQWPCS